VLLAVVTVSLRRCILAFRTCSTSSSGRTGIYGRYDETEATRKRKKDESEASLRVLFSSVLILSFLSSVVARREIFDRFSFSVSLSPHRVGILAALAVAASCGFWLWKRRRSTTLSEDYVSSERTSTGPWYPPPRYSRCSSFVQALPPPYNEVHSRRLILFALFAYLCSFFPFVSGNGNPSVLPYRCALYSRSSAVCSIDPGDRETGPVPTGDRLRREFGQRNFRLRDALLQIAVSCQHLGFLEFQLHVQRRQRSQHRRSTAVLLRRQRR